MQTIRMVSRNAERRRDVARAAALLIAGAMLVSCDAPVGRAPDLQGTYWDNALVTNPNGGGPQVVRWGPPQNFNPSGRE